MRVGIGYDIHKLVVGRKMVLGGVEIEHPLGPLGHSDGDVLLHSICDAILGALSKGDIGTHFPDNDPKYKDIDSKELLRRVNNMMKQEGYEIGNLDSILIAESPKTGSIRDKIIGSVSEILETQKSRLSLKAKTAEQMGDIGEGKAIAAYTIVLLGRRP